MLSAIAVLRLVGWTRALVVIGGVQGSAVLWKCSDHAWDLDVVRFGTERIGGGLRLLLYG